MNKNKILPFLSVLAFSMQAFSASLLPSPFDIPSEPSPGVSSCSTCSGGGKNNAEAPSLDLDGVAHVVVTLADFPLLKNSLLTISIGDNMQFSPTEIYQLIPPGAQGGSPDSIIVSLSWKKIGFNAKISDIGDVSFSSLNYPGYAILRKNERLILKDITRSQDYIFASPDGGIKWKLDEIRNATFPAMNLKCEYDEKGYMSKITLPDKSEYRIEHKGGLPVKVTDPAGAVTEISWDERSHVKRVTTCVPPGHPFFRSKEKSAVKPCIIRDIHAECDAQGRLLSLVTTAGEKYATEYRSNNDEKGKIETFCGILTAPDKRKIYVKKSFSLKDGVQTTEKGYLEQDKSGNEIFESAEQEIRKRKSGTLVLFSKSENGRTTKYERNSDTVAITGETDPLGRTTRFKYNPAGLKTETTYPDGSLTRSEYDSMGHLVKRTDECGRTTSYNYGKNGLLDSVDNAGMVTKYEYDAQNRPVKTVLPDGSVHSFVWDSLFRMTSHSNPDGSTVSYEYPAHFRTPAKIEINGNEVSQSSTGVPPVLDLGRPAPGSSTGVSPVLDPGCPAPGSSTGVPPVSSEKGTAGRAERKTFSRIFTYDPTGKLAKILFPDGTFEGFDYGCCGLLKAVDRAGGVRKFIYDASNRKIEDVSPNGETTRWKYNPRGRVVEVIQANGTSTKYEYDKFGEKAKVIEPDASFVEFKYDAAGNKIEAKYFTPQNKDVSASKGAGQIKTDEGPLVASTGDRGGRPAGETFSSSVYKYDDRDRLLSVSGDHEKHTLYTYDLSGRILKIADHGLPLVADARITENVYDNAGRRIQTVHPDGSVETFQYLPGSDKLKGSILNGIVTSYKYDNAGKISAVAKYPVEELKNNPGTAVFDQFIVETRNYDVFGNLFEVRRAVESSKQ